MVHKTISLIILYKEELLIVDFYTKVV